MTPRLLFLISAFWLLLPGLARAEGDTYKVTHVRGPVYVLTAESGGNVAVSAGDDGVFLIDDQYIQTTDELVAAVRSISAAPIKFVLNTHWHGDHTGGNEVMGEQGALIMGHDNVRERLSKPAQRGDRVIEAKPEIALPVITFSDQISIYINGDEARATHFANAHTDGDSVIYFKRANILHAGDLMFEKGYPLVDLSSGGSIDGYVAAVGTLVDMISDDTIVIPGHGKVTGKQGLEEYYVMLKTIRDRVRTMKDDGMTLAEVLAAKPSTEFDQRWAWNYIDGDSFVETVYTSLP